MVPKSGTRVLVTSGEVDIKAVYNGQSVSLKSDSICRVTVPTYSVAVTDLKLYVGQNISSSYFNDVDWSLSSSNGLKNVGIHTSGIDSVNIISDKLDLIGCDRLWSQQDVVTCTLTVHAAGKTIPDVTKVMAYAVFTNVNAVMGFEHVPNSIGGSMFLGENIPGQPIYFAAFTVFGGKFYAGTLEATPKNGESYVLTIKEADAEAFKTQLNKL
jgi:hypothetical protein